MTMNPLPPQAYTKDILLKAYQWLMGQNSSIKEMATTPDILVSLYLKATRDGDHALDRPSIQNFKNELRSLAGMMGELDRPATPPVAPVAKQPATPVPATTPTAAPRPPAGASYTETPVVPSKIERSDLDSETLAMIREVKEELNLSSESEALRMLVKVGFKKTKGLYC